MLSAGTFESRRRVVLTSRQLYECKTLDSKNIEMKTTVMNIINPVESAFKVVSIQF